jgi:hypothetical protein
MAIIARSNMARAMLADSEVYEGKLAPGIAARKHGFASTDEAVKFLVDLFVQGDLPHEVSAKLVEGARAGGDPDQRLRRLAHAIVTLPEFHLA